MKKPVIRKLRCAVYTRKSSEEGLEQEFNSLDAQREACEAYITSQKAEGWLLVPDRYDDGGISGATLVVLADPLEPSNRLQRSVRESV
jgi:DNA invertase Pin-like site-specific DNA recombinase